MHELSTLISLLLFVFTYVSFPVFFYANMIVKKNEVLNKVKLKLNSQILLPNQEVRYESEYNNVMNKASVIYMFANSNEFLVKINNL